jgi:hypothetical protein
MSNASSGFGPPVIAEHLRAFVRAAGGVRALARRWEIPLSPKERRAYQAYVDVMGPGSMAWFTRPAAQTVADEAARAVMEHVRKDANT